MSPRASEDLTPRKWDVSCTQNRELSWLRFNQRVLQEANDSFNPLFERLKFIAIFTSNLDEFFMIRVGSLFDMSVIDPQQIDNKCNLTPIEQLDAVFAVIPDLIALRDRNYKRVSDHLRAEGVCDLEVAELTKREAKEVREYFRDFVEPVLSPQIIDARHPFPHLANLQLYLGAWLKDEDGSAALGILPVPDSLPPIYQLHDDPLRFVRLDNLIAANIDQLFGLFKVESSCVFSITRNADISFDDIKFEDIDSSEDYPVRVSRLLKKRNRLQPVRLEILGNPSKQLRNTLVDRLHIKDDQVYCYNAPISLQHIYSLEKPIEDAGLNHLLFKPYTPRWPEGLDARRPIFDQIVDHDLMIHYPYDSMSPFLQMLKEAVADNDVLSIKMTIYRLAKNSLIAQQLCMAAENGKNVIVLMELRARFDEENNLFWSDQLERAGCRVIYGLDNFKCHSKICQITRQSADGVQTITQIGTGNYNEKTATLYTDLCLFTSNEAIAADGIAFFKNLLVSNLKGDYNSLVVAPKDMKPRILAGIDSQIALGEQGRILIKINSLTERDTIDKLIEASMAGVKIILICRGICCLRPGIKGKTDNITVRSIVGRFLEHSRIYCFGSEDDQVIYISSADLMTRNIVRRVELACPIYDPVIREQIREILSILLKDNTKARVLQPDGTYKKIKMPGERFAAQEWLMNHTLTAVPATLPQPKQGFWVRAKQWFTRK